jgi:CHAT domain-containing protein
MADLDEWLARPLVDWLKTVPVQRVFLVAGTSAAILPLHACQSVIDSEIELAVLPTSFALRVVREPRTPPIELFHPVNLFEHQGDFAAARDRMVLVVDPTRSLTYAPWEAGAVHAAARKGQVDVFDSAPVDIPGFARAARVADALHLIVHGRFDDNSPYRSGVYFHGPEQAERLWTVADTFSQLDAPAGRIAVLSGCETGLTRPNLISEEVSLPSALIAAGFAAVIATKWSVDDLSTALLTGEFYRRWHGGGVTLCRALSESADWLKGLDKAKARASVTQLARRLAGDPHAAVGGDWNAIAAKAERDIEAGPERPFDDAYYWAPFFVAGDGALTAEGVDSRTPSPNGSAARIRAL